MSFEPETRFCPECHRRGCWTLEEEGQVGLEYFETWVCKCGHAEYIEHYDCPIHGMMEGGECPRC